MYTSRLAASPYTGAPFTVPPAVVPGIMPAVLYLDDPNVKAMHGLAHNCAQKTVMSGVMGFGLGGLFGLFTASMAYDTPFHAPPPIPAPAPTPGPGSATAAAASMTGQPPAATPPTPAAATSAAVAAPTPTAAAATAPPPPPGATAAVASAKPRPAVVTLTAPALTAPAAPAPSVLVPISSLPMREQLRHGFRDMGSRSYSMARSFGKVGALFAGIECGVEGLRARNDATNGVVAGCLTGGVLALGAGPQAAAGGCVAFAAFSAAIEAWLRSDSGGDD